ncbi:MULTISPECIES: HEAT repeat domain-containing protein [Cyanophyceae]|uniref:HEAT repeat domain-containing protein n=1 Tax=Cyanophyceae TaxID=3028117 RepID=UPI001684910F|nr:HEAT repeat domain-containing protein [Trichocoleus sp. FACHB-40]MBD2006241.1 HEAT repeat domain-containing protein [Trichocoleus sp. FACHB-40]
MDWLAAWGVYTVAGFVFTEVLAPLAKGALEDYVKDFFKDSIKDFTGLFQKDTLQKAVGKALKEFLQLMQQELEDAELSEEQLKAYITPFNQFINDKSVKEILGSAFQYDCQAINIKKLSITWYQLDLLSLPEGFDWEQVGKRYLKKVKAIIRESDELRGIFDSKNIEAIQQNTKELAGISPEFDLTRYQEGLQERYSNLNLDSLDTTVYDYREKLKVWEIFIAQNVRECQEYLPQVYEIPKEHQKRLRESNQIEADVNPEEWERYKKVYYQQPIRSVLDIVNDSQTYPYIVILGDPGSGKSTLLQYIALNWARTPLNTVIEQPIPLLIELRTYIRNRDSGECKDFLEFFHKGCGIVCRLNQHELHEQLKAGKVSVMFDGLDEVFDPAKREEVIIDIHRFTNDYPKARVIVTSRIIGYKPQRLRDAQFRHFMLQDLESDQIEDFLYRWHELTFTDEALKVSKRERLQQAIKTSSAIGELAGNPLLLTMMAILNRKQELPRYRPILYEKASEVLLHQWDVDQKLLENPRIDSVTIDYKDKQAILRQVAYFMQAADQGLAGNLIRGDDLEKILTSFLKSREVNQPRTVARLLIEQMRSRNFILCFLGADSYGFVHRTFLEYFCACEFVERFGKRGIEGGLTLEELKTEVFSKHWQDESWHEVLRLVTGMIDTKFAGEILDYLMAQKGEDEKFINLFLAAECLLEVRNRSAIAVTSDQLLNQMKGLSQYDLPYDYIPYGVEANLVWEIRTQAVSSVATTWKDDPDTLPWLKQRAQADDDSDVRQAAVQELARGWKDDPDTLPWLKQRAQADDDSDVRQAAVQELARGWKDDPDTLPILKQRAQADDNPAVRQVAVQKLARGWKDDPDTLPILKQQAQANDDWRVRQAAVRELARGWKDDPDTLPWLKQRAQTDDHWYVRHAALEELAPGWNDEPDMFEFLHNRALNDSFKREYDFQTNPRQYALEAVIKNYPDHPRTLSLLRDRSLNDPDETVREFASEELKKLDQ